ncbi:hypothetical protein HaLaN_06672, partial [Haematococcus lacustris]
GNRIVCLFGSWHDTHVTIVAAGAAAATSGAGLCRAAHWAQDVTQGGMAEQGDKRMTASAAVQGADSLDEEVQAKVLEQQEREVLQAI